MIATIIVAVVGLLTTAAAPWVQTRLEAKRDRDAWQRNERSAVYSDALVHAQKLESSLVRMVDPMTSRPPQPMDVAPADLITARMRLLATGKAFDAWLQLRETEDAFWWTVGEDFPALGYEDPFDGLPADYSSLIELRQRLAAFYLTTRLEFAIEPEG